MSYYSREELAGLNLGACGANVLISRKASLYNPGRIRLGDNVRIDDFCILSAGAGGIVVGRNVHIAAYSGMFGAGRIEIGDFSNLSSRVSIYSSSDDYSGLSMTNPTIPERFKQVVSDDVHVGAHVIIGSGSVVLPGVRLETGVAVGALSLVKSSVPEFCIVAGVPAREVATRSRRLLELEREYLAQQNDNKEPDIR